MNGAAAGFVPGGGAGGAGGAGATVEDMGGLAGGWMEMGRGMDDGFPVTAMAFDPVEELLWVRLHGRVGKRRRSATNKSDSLSAHDSSARLHFHTQPDQPHPHRQTGSQNGRLSAFSQPDMVKHVSVLGHGAGNPQQPQPSPVRQIRPFLEGASLCLSGRLGWVN